MTREIQYTKVLTDDSSFQLVRTNPKLTGNVKLTINEAGDMWLNAIKANLELAKDDYARFPIDIAQSLPANIYQFFKNGETPKEIIFALTESIDLVKTSKDFKDQFDFSNYFSGIKYFPSNKYEEKLTYFAPLYLKKNLPNYFVILKMKGPLNNQIVQDRQNFESGQTRDQYLIELFKTATIVKTFDLSPTSNPGKYLRTYLNSPGFPVSPLTVSFNENDYTTWNGILVDSGVFGSKGELLYSQYADSTPLKFFEENITNGFERNGVILPNIVNLEFIFDDETSNDYEFDRYLGLYVDTVELSKLDIDLARLYTERTIWPNSPKLRKEYFESDEVKLFQSNQNGIVLPIKNLDLNLNEFSTMFTDADSLYFNYITDKDNKLRLPKLTSPYTIERSNEVAVSLNAVGTMITATVVSSHAFDTGDLVQIVSPDPEYAGEFFVTKLSDTQFQYILTSTPTNAAANGNASQEVGQAKITLSDREIDLGKFIGASNDLFLQDAGFASKIGGHSHAVIKIKSQLSHLDEFKLYHPAGTRSDSGGKYDVFTATVGYTLIPNPGEYYAFNDYDNVTGYDTFYFNATGLAKEIAKAIEGCLNKVRNRDFTAYAYDDHIFIKCNVPGNFDAIHKLTFSSFYSQYSSIEINDTTDNDIIGQSFNFVGGSRFAGNRLVLNKKHLSKIKDNFDDILVRTEIGWSKIKKYSTYIDEVNDVNQLTEELRSKQISEYLNHFVLILEDEEVPSIKYTEFVMRKKFRPSFGFISMLPIKDLDFDFYSSEYLNFPLIDLYQHYFIPEGVKLLIPGVTYTVLGGNIKVEGVDYLENSTFTVVSQAKYTVTSGNAFVAYDQTSLIEPIFDKNKELNDFEGFSILKDPDKVIPADGTDSYLLRTKYVNGVTDTEYDFYKENASKDFALRSKILPYITKWAIKNGKDSRDNQYRLNTEIVFGRNNFAPDHTTYTQKTSAFTHEWFYIESQFNYLYDKETVKANSYYFEKPFDLGLATSDPNYFIEYFTYTPIIDAAYSESGKDEEVGPTQLRYASVYKNQAGKYETFFKGFKVEFNDVTDTSVIGEDGKPVANTSTTRFEDYKFSCILKVVKEDFASLDTPPLRFRVIEHKDYKFIVLIIELTLSTIDMIDDYWKSPNQYKAINNNQTVPPPASYPTLFLGDVISEPLFLGKYPFETVEGDYRFMINQVDGQDISNLTHSLLYSIKNKKFNTEIDNFSTTKLSMKFNYSESNSQGVDFGAKTITKILNPNFTNYPALVSDEVAAPTDSTVLMMKTSSISYLLLDTLDSLSNATQVNPIIGSTANSIIFASNLTPANLALTALIPVPPYTVFSNTFPLPGFIDVITNNYLFELALGGQKYYEKLFEKISFARFKGYVNSLDPIIEFETYSLDSNGSPMLDTSVDYYISIPDQSEVIKTTQAIVNSDQDKPTQFSFNEVIGYTYEQATLNNPVRLNRYQGNYEPITRDVLFCNSSFNFVKNDIESIKLANVRFNTKIDDLLTLKNFNHIKVADSKILTLETDEAYTPVYPLIDEVAIGQADYFLLAGNWDWGFHKKYLNKTEYSAVAGSLRVEEDESFMGKILKVPTSVELEQFAVTTLAANQNLADVDLSQIEIVVKETPTSVDGYINLSNALTSYFISQGILQSFNAFLTNSNEYLGNYDSIENYVKDYIRLNLLKLYELETAEFYSKPDAAVVSTQSLQNINTIEFDFLDDTQRFAGGYSLLKTTKINKSDRLVVNFSIPKSVSTGLRVSPKIKIKFI